MTNAGNYVFESAEDALKWAVEVVRRRRLPKTASFWREIEAEVEWVAQAWQGPKNLNLPQDAEGRMELALKVMEALNELAARDRVGGKLLELWAWGDWADAGRLATALALQEKCRREGVRVRMAYRYSYVQLGVILDCDRKAAWRRVQEGLALLGDLLAVRGVVGAIQAFEMVNDNFKKMIYSDEFKTYNE